MTEEELRKSLLKMLYGVLDETISVNEGLTITITLFREAGWKSGEETNKCPNCGVEYSSYRLSNSYRIKSKQTIQKRFESYISMEPNTGCWLWMGGGNTDGYGRFGAKEYYPNNRAHRVAWIIYNGFIPPEKWVLHKCDTPCCVNPKHLFLGTPSDNTGDCLKKNRKSIIFTPNQIVDIRNDKRTNRELAKIYNVDHSTISDIQRRKTWKHII